MVTALHVIQTSKSGPASRTTSWLGMLGYHTTRPAVPAQPELALSLQMLLAVAVAPVLPLQEILEQWEL